MKVFRSIREVDLPVGRSCVALGLFDGLHRGHRAVIESMLDTARRENLTPCVFTFSIRDALPASKTGQRQLVPDTLRDQLLSEMGVRYLIFPPFDEIRALSPEDYVRDVLQQSFRAAALFCGEDYRFGRGASGTVEDLRRMAGALEISVHVQPTVILDGMPLSSTRIRQCIEQGDMPGAQRLLGRPFAIHCEVIHGRHLGRTLDFPTINQRLPDWFICPRFGVYATLATVEGKSYISVTNVGIKPTVGSEEILAETCLLGYQGDLYGRRVLVEFLQFIRPEQKFPSIEALRRQIQKDAQTAKEIASRL